MKSNLTFSIFSGVLLTVALASPAIAAQQKVTKMTCQDFLQVDDVVKPKLVYFAEGFNKKGKPEGDVFETETTDHYYPILIEECQKTPEANLMKMIKKVKGGSGG